LGRASMHAFAFVYVPFLVIGCAVMLWRLWRAWTTGTRQGQSRRDGLRLDVIDTLVFAPALVLDLLSIADTSHQAVWYYSLLGLLCGYFLIRLTLRLIRELPPVRFPENRYQHQYHPSVPRLVCLAALYGLVEGIAAGVVLAVFVIWPARTGMNGVEFALQLIIGLLLIRLLIVFARNRSLNARLSTWVYAVEVPPTVWRTTQFRIQGMLLGVCGVLILLIAMVSMIQSSA
jgi:hypothetical protein